MPQFRRNVAFDGIFGQILSEHQQLPIIPLHADADDGVSHSRTVTRISSFLCTPSPEQVSMLH
jgi:hypothetical protein